MDQYHAWSATLRRLEDECAISIYNTGYDIERVCDLVEHLNPQIAIVAIRNRDTEGLRLLSDVATRFSTLRTIAIASCGEVSTVKQALHAGVVGFLTFEEAQNQLIDAVRTVLSGNVYFGQELFRSLLDELLPDARFGLEPLLATLSDRELEVFQAVGEGILVREVAERLDIHVKTVDTYLRRIRKKLGTKTPQQLSEIAKRWMYPENNVG